MIQKEGSGAAQLLQLAQEEGADLPVTGACGVISLGEWNFGGMTESFRRPARSAATCPTDSLPEWFWKKTMQTPVQIDYQGMSARPELQASIKQHVAGEKGPQASTVKLLGKHSLRL